jgi:hypothetical protein
MAFLRVKFGSLVAGFGFSSGRISEIVLFKNRGSSLKFNPRPRVM